MYSPATIMITLSRKPKPMKGKEFTRKSARVWSSVIGVEPCWKAGVSVCWKRIALFLHLSLIKETSERRKKPEIHRKHILHRLFLARPENKNLFCNLKQLFWKKAKSSCREVFATCSTRLLLVPLDAKLAASPEKELYYLLRVYLHQKGPQTGMNSTLTANKKIGSQFLGFCRPIIHQNASEAKQFHSLPS